MIKTVFHIVKRSKELGPLGTFRRVWMRAVNMLVVWSQSLWWGWKARRKMSDAALLARTKGEWRAMDALLSHLASRPASSLLLPHESIQETTLLIKNHYPEYCKAVLAAADAACRNELSLLGQVFHFSPNIDWLCDPVTGWRFPPLHRSRVGQYLGPARPVDLIFFWELNRHQHFITLGIAYWLTGNQRYVDAFIAQIQSWIEANPLQHGVNWYYGLEVSIRLLAWTAAFQFFRSSSVFQEKIGSTFLKSLWQQAEFLSSHLQTVRTRSDVPNNHLMAELTGLVLVGSAFPEFRSALTWRETGLRLLIQQATAQTHPDGVNKEQAMGYHRFITELLLLVVARSRQGAFPPEHVLENTLERMLDYVLYTQTPVGSSPMWGDSDFGRALGLGHNKDFWDFRPMLSAGAVLFGRPDWKFAAGCFDEEAFLILGTTGLDIWEQLDIQPPGQVSHAFTQAGMYVIRDAWTPDTDAAYFRCGSFGLGGDGHCAHAHCDLLSIVLWINGQPVLVDSGTYMYHGPLRDHFRLTAAHNTVMVDGRDQAVPMTHFNWKKISDAKCIEWTGDRVIGFMLCSNQVEVIRDLFQTRPGTWELVDRFTGHNEHSLEWFFHFAPGLDLQLEDGKRTLTVLKDARPFLYMHLPENGISSELRDTWFSEQYGVKQSNRQLYVQWRGELADKKASFHWQFQLVNERHIPMKG